MIKKKMLCLPVFFGTALPIDLSVEDNEEEDVEDDEKTSGDDRAENRKKTERGSKRLVGKNNFEIY